MKTVMVIEKHNDIWLIDDKIFRPVQTYNNVLWYDSFYGDNGIGYNRLWLANDKTATFNSNDYAFVVIK